MDVLDLAQFQNNCFKKATLVHTRKMSRQDAIDSLQHEAVATGLITNFGQDAIQAIMAREFGDSGTFGSGHGVMIAASDYPSGIQHETDWASLQAFMAEDSIITRSQEILRYSDDPLLVQRGERGEAPHDRVFGSLSDTASSMAKRQSAIANGQTLSPHLNVIRAADLFGQSIQPRAWHVADVIPARNVTLLQGDGGTGKSLLALMLAAATVCGKPWIGLEDVQRGPAIYLSAEDELSELHRRLEVIASSMSVSLQDFRDLHLIPIAGEDAILAAPCHRSNVIAPTPLWTAVEGYVSQIQPSLVVLDTLADLFAGEENQRSQARQFISMLRRLALQYNTCVLLLGHPSLEGLKSGKGTSGSTGWNNSVRSRLYLERISTPEGQRSVEHDEDLRELSVKKINYGRKSDPIRLKWCGGIFQRQTGDSFGLNAGQRGAAAEETFLTLLQLHEEFGLPLSPNVSSRYAPTVFAKHTGSKGITKHAFKGAMERLLESHRIRLVPDGPPSKRRMRLTAYSEERV